MADLAANPHLSGPDEDGVCYACEEVIDGRPWVVSDGSPAGQFLRVPADQMVEICDECMELTADETAGDVDRILRSLGHEPDWEGEDV
jgi:uncharacterized protein CbrC (UPF0167 family)